MPGHDARPMAMTNKTQRIKIDVATVTAIAGDLYEIHTEDSVAHVYDWSVEVKAQGKTYLLVGAVRGFFVVDGYKLVNRNHQRQIDALVTWIKEVGSINPAKWAIVTDDWQARAEAMAQAAYLRDEQAEWRGWSGWS